MNSWRDVKDIATHGKALEAKRRVPLHLAVVGAEGVALHEVARTMTPLTERAVVETVVAGPQAASLDAGVELAVLVCETLPAGLTETIERLRRDSVQFVAVRPGIHTGLSRPSDETMRGLGAGEPLDLDTGSERLEEELFEAIIERLPAKKLALCANFAGARRRAAKDVIGHTSWQNGLLAGVIIVPGADMPILTGNQIKMVLELAAIHGKQMTFARAKELIAVVGAGFTFRTIARELLDFIPGPGWPVKAVVAYFGTGAMGRAAEQYMIHGDEWAKAARDKMTELKRGRTFDAPRLHLQAADEPAAPGARSEIEAPKQ